VAPDAILDRCRGPVLGHDDRKIPLHFGIPGHGLHADGSVRGHVQPGDGQLRHDHPTGPQIEALHDVRVDLRDSPGQGLAGTAADGQQRSPGMEREARPSAVQTGTGRPSPRQSASTRPLASSRSYARRGRFQAGGWAAPAQQSQPGPLHRNAVDPGIRLPISKTATSGAWRSFRDSTLGRLPETLRRRTGDSPTADSSRRQRRRCGLRVRLEGPDR
jgi:hypothetical protein